MKRVCVLVLLLAACGVARAEDAATAQREFQQLFGGDMKRVTATPDTRDDLELAEMLLDAAKLAGDKPELQALLCEQAATLAGRTGAGMELAAKAFQSLADYSPSRRVEALQKAADLIQRQYTNSHGGDRAEIGEHLIQLQLTLATELQKHDDYDGATLQLRKAMMLASVIHSDSRDRVRAELDHVVAGQRQARQIDLLKSKLKQNHDDHASADELLKLYVIDRDDPDEARKYSFLSADAKLVSRVRLATTPVEELDEAQCFKLGDWYWSLVDQAHNPPAKLAMLQRANQYYGRFMDLHTADDLPRTKARLMKSKIDDRVAQLQRAASDTGRGGRR